MKAEYVLVMPSPLPSEVTPSLSCPLPVSGTLKSPPAGRPEQPAGPPHQEPLKLLKSLHPDFLSTLPHPDFAQEEGV